MTMATSGAEHDKHEARFQRSRLGRLGNGEVDRIAKRMVRIKAQHNVETQVKPFDLATHFAGAAAGIALIFSVMVWISSSTQDKVDKGTAPLTVQIGEMDKRLSGRLDAVDKRLTEGFAAVDKRLDRVEAHADKTDERLSRMEANLNRIDSQIDSRFAAIERKLDQLVKRR
jgi:septal ring factor EnvC (AmiA/AmiB activator)